MPYWKLTLVDCKVARTDKSFSEHVLCTYLTPSPTNWALYLRRAVQIRLRTILSFIVIKYELKIFSADFRSQLFYLYSRAGEPGVFGSLEPEPVEKETRSRSRLDKMLGAGDAK